MSLHVIENWNGSLAVIYELKPADLNMTALFLGKIIICISYHHVTQMSQIVEIFTCWRQGATYLIDNTMTADDPAMPGLLTHWGRVTHICVSKLNTIASDNGLLPDRRQAIIWINAKILLIGPLGTNFSDILIGIQTFSFRKMHLKTSSAKRRPFCLGLNVLRSQGSSTCGITLFLPEYSGLSTLTAFPNGFHATSANCTNKHQMLIILTNPMSDIWILRLTKLTWFREYWYKKDSLQKLLVPWSTLIF